MLRKTYNINLVGSYLRDHPNPKNKDLYSYCNATTDSQKQCVRRKKLSLQKKAISPGLKLPGKKKLTEEFIEQLIVKGLENNPGNVQLIGKATDFFIKVKNKTSEMEDEIDMEMLKEIGLVIKTGD